MSRLTGWASVEVELSLGGPYGRSLVRFSAELSSEIK